MKKKLQLILLMLPLLTATAFSQAPNWLWAKGIGGTSDDIGVSVVTDPLGNVYTTGHFSGTFDFDSGPGIFNLISSGIEDIFISKYDAFGNFVWAKGMDGTDFADGFSIALDSFDNVYTTGSYKGTVDFDPGIGTFNIYAAGGFFDIFISKLDSAGNFVWAKRIGGPTTTFNDNFGSSITIDASGNIYITGAFQGLVDFDPDSIGIFNLSSSGGYEIFISKLDSSGNFVWAKKMGGTGSDMGLSIAHDASGNVYTTGHFSGTVDFNPGLGTYNLISFDSTDIFISKLDSSGNFLWAKAMGGLGDDFSRFIAIDAIGNIYNTGQFSGTVDFDSGTGVFNLTSNGNHDIFISKLNASGNFIWAKAIGGSGEDYCYSISLDVSGNIYTTGFFNGSIDFDPSSSGTFNLTSNGNSDIFISKLDSSGNFIWAKATGGTDEDEGLSITLDIFDNAYITGYFYSPTIIFDSTILVNADNSGTTSDLFIAKLNSGSISSVWPGDANYDLVADYNDLLNIGIAYGDTGFTRPSASTNYTAQPCTDWSNQFITGINHKHADTDGNGIVNAADTLAVSLNYGQSHPFRHAKPEQTSGINPDLYFDAPAGLVYPGDTVKVPIMLGNSIAQAFNVYGIALAISYNPAVVKQGSMWIDYDSSWVAGHGNYIHIQKDFPSTGEFDMGFSRINHTDTSGFGNIGTLHFIIDGGAFSQQMILSFYHEYITNSSEGEVHVTQVNDTLFTTVPETYSSIAFSLSPNPVRTKTHLVFDNSAHATFILQLTDVTGRLVQPQQTVTGNDVWIERKNLSAGIYFINLVDDKNKNRLRAKVVME